MVKKRIIRPNMTAGRIRMTSAKTRTANFAALSDIERLRAGIGTDPRNVDEPFDFGSLHLSGALLGRLDVDGIQNVKADCIHRAVRTQQARRLIMNVGLDRSKSEIIRWE